MAISLRADYGSQNKPLQTDPSVTFSLGAVAPGRLVAVFVVCSAGANPVITGLGATAWGSAASFTGLSHRGFIFVKRPTEDWSAGSEITVSIETGAGQAYLFAWCVEFGGLAPATTADSLPDGSGNPWDMGGARAVTFPALDLVLAAWDRNDGLDAGETSAPSGYTSLGDETGSHTNAFGDFAYAGHPFYRVSEGSESLDPSGTVTPAAASGKLLSVSCSASLWENPDAEDYDPEESGGGGGGDPGGGGGEDPPGGGGDEDGDGGEEGGGGGPPDGGGTEDDDGGEDGDDGSGGPPSGGGGGDDDGGEDGDDGGGGTPGGGGTENPNGGDCPDQTGGTGAADFSASFEQEDGALPLTLDTGQDWQSVGGILETNWKTRSGRAYNDAQQDVLYADGGSADGWLEARFWTTDPAARECGLAFRVSSDETQFLFAGNFASFLGEADGVLRLATYDDGALVILWEHTERLADGSTLAVELDGTTINLYVDGELVRSETSSFSQAGEGHGLFMDPEAEADDFRFYLAAPAGGEGGGGGVTASADGGEC